MANKTCFKEHQKFSQAWLVILLLISNVIILRSLLKDINLDFTMLTKLHIMIPIGGLILINLLFLFARLRTRIDEAGIGVLFFPFHWREVFYSWAEIEKAEVITYNPIMDYGGWGVRVWFGKKAFNVKGDQGLQLHFKDGRKRLIGTQKPEEIKEKLVELSKTEAF